MPFIGVGSFVGIGEEATWNTGVVSTRFLPLMGSGDGFEYKQEHIESEDIVDAVVNKANVYQGQKSVTNSLELELNHQGFGWIFKHAFGVAASTSGTGPYTHSFSPPVTPTGIIGKGLTMTVQRGTGTSAFRYTGIKINRLQLTGEQNSIVKCAIDIMGAGVSKVTPPVPSYTGLSNKVRMASGQATDLLTINAIARVCRSFTFTYENGYELTWGGEKQTPSEPYRNRASATLEATLEFADFNEWDDYVAGNFRQVILTVKDGTGDNEIVITGDNALLDSNPTPFVNSLGIITWTPTFKLYGGAGRELTFDYTNGLATATP